MAWQAQDMGAVGVCFNVRFVEVALNTVRSYRGVSTMASTRQVLVRLQ
jgi:hypothetical protein